jgi:hypothetical protein
MLNVWSEYPKTWPKNCLKNLPTMVSTLWEISTFILILTCNRNQRHSRAPPCQRERWDSLMTLWARKDHPNHLADQTWPQLNVLIGCSKHMYTRGWGGGPLCYPPLGGFRDLQCRSFSTRNVGQICCIVELAFLPCPWKSRSALLHTLAHWPYFESQRVYFNPHYWAYCCAYCWVNEF